jgi:hypothetical protein
MTTVLATMTAQQPLALLSNVYNPTSPGGERLGVVVRMSVPVLWNAGVDELQTELRGGCWMLKRYDAYEILRNPKHYETDNPGVGAEHATVSRPPGLLRARGHTQVGQTYWPVLGGSARRLKQGGYG